jgi:NADH:ubiquinone oxidoreductase subunit F (NADH-binding)/(2Fe-2S) ferredoxin
MKVSGKKDLQKLQKDGMASLFPDRIRIMVGMATCCLAKGSAEVMTALKDEIKKQGLKAEVVPVGCIGLCCQEPTIEVVQPGKPKVTYGEMTPDKISSLVTGIARGTVDKQSALYRTDKEELLLTGTKHIFSKGAPAKEFKGLQEYAAMPFYKKQRKVALRNAGFIDPENISEYIARGGYSALVNTLATMKPDAVIAEVTKAGLRGRSGGGFPTGVKWQACRRAEGKAKYFICNVSEGDPGIGMHKSLLESDPHSVLEGMIIGAYAIGAKEGYIYISSGQPLGVRRMDKAVADAKAYGFLGKNIMKSGFDFTVKVKEGAGAYVCGEETALIKSIEGDWGEPRQRPPYPAVSGLWGKPTVINNVETLANVPVVMGKGAKWYSAIGSAKSKGTKVFSIVGEVNRPGLIEVPMGTTLREIIYDVGGGLPKGKTLKAVLAGGPAGGCVPKKLMNLPVDYEALMQAGSAMSSGGIIVMGEDTCMVDMNKYLLSFTEGESCGKCTPCRVGVRRMREIITDISEGKGRDGDIELLEKMALLIKDGALCNLGKTAPNPVLATLRYFKEEYQKHIKNKKCSAAVCTSLKK